MTNVAQKHWACAIRSSNFNPWDFFEVIFGVKAALVYRVFAATCVCVCVYTSICADLQRPSRCSTCPPQWSAGRLHGNSCVSLWDRDTLDPLEETAKAKQIWISNLWQYEIKHFRSCCFEDSPVKENLLTITKMCSLSYLNHIMYLCCIHLYWTYLYCCQLFMWEKRSWLIELVIAVFGFRHWLIPNCYVQKRGSKWFSFFPAISLNKNMAFYSMLQKRMPVHMAGWPHWYHCSG